MEIELPEDSPPGWTMLAASGDVDVTSAHVLRERVEDLLSEGTTRLLVDLDGVDFIDSTGLSALVEVTDHARSVGGEVQVVCADARLRTLVDTAGISDSLTLVDAVDPGTSRP